MKILVVGRATKETNPTIATAANERSQDNKMYERISLLTSQRVGLDGEPDNFAEHVATAESSFSLLLVPQELKIQLKISRRTKIGGGSYQERHRNGNECIGEGTSTEP